ncbi:Anaerobic glycerol-3-phosphate dehydrogenase subunit C [Posidoniimonas polymericola]|uniref:Anaerobic glycerol-3-phosphate dehydrogenase subunit C n=1 Tax=Posidoniimonas polymericola TaxID=2528002 RepID=A0A5C5XYP8_9BACT|nr:anaerobic glycerol-3-phosphate dehydrogenase subunit C [Posidoniimonas polymericola]TWT67659.1 Anaerobic glycerol-3-phosphate dehydrogenase subunit C [Posidoniimonas polymericola]
MDSDRQRIEQDLRGQLAGEVNCDPLSVCLYASDASIYQKTPLGVVRPRTTADVATTLRYANENGIAVHARGAGSGLAGGVVGEGLVIDFSRHMRRIIRVGEESVRVQAGVVHAELNRALAAHGRVFGPDPATTEVTTIGGVLSVDGSGSHWPWCGSARDHVLAMKVVLADGEVLELGAPPTDAPPPARLAELALSVQELGQLHRTVIETNQPQSLVNASGYAMQHALTDPVDLTKLMVGSEGTLALIVEAELSTLPLPASVGRVMLMFDSLEKAVRCVREITPLGPCSCDLMDRRHLTIARESDVRYDLIIPAAAEAVLLLEFFGETEQDTQHQVDRVVALARNELGLAAGYYAAQEEEDELLLGQLARRFTQTLHGLKGRRRAAPCIEDIAVPVEAMPVFVRHLQDVLKRQQITASLFSHAAHGQLHIRPLLDLRTKEDARRLELLASELYEKVWLLGGTVAGEHGDGLSRTPFLRRQHGPLINVFRELKRAFDPNGILNPGKIIPTPGERVTQNFRPSELAKPSEEGHSLVELSLNWTREELNEAAWACNGCAGCRTLSPAVRMCPIFRFAPREEASPRAKANLVRGVLTGQLPPDALRHDDAREVADLCVHCHQCRLECPAKVDIPRMMVEAKAAHIKQNGLRPRDWSLTRMDLLSQIGSRFATLMNLLIDDRRARWVLARTLGIAEGRKLPRFAARPFLRSAGKRLSKPVPGAVEKVAYFVDTFANYYDSQLAESFVAVLRHNGVGVVAPGEQEQSGMALYSQGAVDAARKIARRNVEALAELARQGYAIVATEPSAVLALTHEYLQLLDHDEDAQLVADSTHEACDYLWKLHQRGGLKLDLHPIDRRVAYHVPCHVRALGIGAPAGNLLRLIPQLRVKQLEKGCSGMAGMFGLRKENYRRSLRAGLPLLTELRTGNYDLSVSECSTCAIQMRQASPRPTLHPIKLLAASYGLPCGLDANLAGATIANGRK